MFPRQLSSLGSTFFPHNLLPAAALRAGFSSSGPSHFRFPPPALRRPWWWVRGGPPRPPYRLPSHPAGLHFSVDFRTLTALDRNANGFSGNFAGRGRPLSQTEFSVPFSPGFQPRLLHALGGQMDREQEPPRKRRKRAGEWRKSAEDKGGGGGAGEWRKSAEDKGGGGGGAATPGPGKAGGKAKEGGPKREHPRPDPGAIAGPRPPNSGRSKDRSRDGEKTRDVDKVKERTRDGEKVRGRNIDGGKGPTTDGSATVRTRDKVRSASEQGRSKESLGPRTQASGPHPSPKHKPLSKESLGPRTQASMPNPSGPHSSPKHKPLSKDGGKVEARGGEERGGQRAGPEAGGHRTKEGGPRREPPAQPPPNPWFKDGAKKQPPLPSPPPPGTLPTRKPHMTRALQRHWEVAPACSTRLHPPGVAPFDFSVLSYNILSQDLLRDNVYLYKHCDPSVLPWENRLPHLLEEIQHYNADILCLQEVQENHYETQIKPALQAQGYHCEYKKRTGRKPDGCAVVFKSSRFTLLSSHPVEYIRPRDPLLDRDNVGLVLLLRPTTSAQSNPSDFIIVANTHLLYNPRRGDIKLAQLAILLAEITRLSRLPDGSSSPVVLCGDFNSVPWSPLYSFLTTGCLEYQGLPIGTVSGQEDSTRGQRILTAPIWSSSLGINQRCQYENPTTDHATPSPTTDQATPSPTGVAGGISNLSVEDLAAKAVAAFNSGSPRIEHSVTLRSVYQHQLPPDGRAEVTTCHSCTAVTVDYLLYTPVSNPPTSLPAGRGLQPLGRLSLVGQPELEEVNGLPNQHHSSDHLPLLARFRLQR